MNQEEQAKKMQKIIAKAWIDEDFKQRLLAEPAAVLREEGLETPPDVEIRMVENTEKQFHIVLPVQPDNVNIETVSNRDSALYYSDKTIASYPGV